MHLIPYGVMKEVAKVMKHGADKYGPYNWREKEIMFSQYYGANARHMGAWWEREDIDPDSELLHIFHAIASNIVLADAILHNKVIDDRPKK